MDLAVALPGSVREAVHMLVGLEPDELYDEHSFAVPSSGSQKDLLPLPVVSMSAEDLTDELWHGYKRFRAGVDAWLLALAVHLNHEYSLR
eukprot:5688690-Amphidinium_carterae.2